MASTFAPIPSLVMFCDCVYSTEHELPPIKQVSSPIKGVGNYTHEQSCYSETLMSMFPIWLVL